MCQGKCILLACLDASALGSANAQASALTEKNLVHVARNILRCRQVARRITIKTGIYHLELNALLSQMLPGWLLSKRKCKACLFLIIG